MKTIDEILIDASQECEDANYHDLCGLPESLYAVIKDYIPPENRRSVAEAIASEIVGKI